MQEVFGQEEEDDERDLKERLLVAKLLWDTLDHGKTSPLGLYSSQ